MTPPEGEDAPVAVKLEEDAPAAVKLEQEQENGNEGWTKVEKRKGKKHKKTEGKQDVCVGFSVVWCLLC